MSTSKAVIKLGSLKDGWRRLISIKYDHQYGYYIMKYEDASNNVLTDTISKNNKKYKQEVLELLYSAKFYDDYIVVCFKTDIQRMFKIRRTSYMPFYDFLCHNEFILRLFSEGCRFIKLVNSIGTIKDVNLFVESANIESYINYSKHNMHAITRLTPLAYAYESYKFVRRVISELQKIGYYTYDPSINNYIVNLIKIE